MSPTPSRTIFVIAVLTCAVAQLFLLRSVLRVSAREEYEDERRKNPRRGGFRWTSDRRRDPASDHALPSRRSELAWVVIPAVGLAALLYFSWLALPIR